MTLELVAEQWLREMIAVTWQFSALAGMTWVLLALLGRRLSPRARHLICFLVLLRLIVPVGFESPWGIGKNPAASSKLAPSTAERPSGATTVSTAPGPVPHTEPAAPVAMGPAVIIFIVWMALTMLLLLIWWMRHHRLKARLRRSRWEVPEELQLEIDRLAGHLGLKTPIGAELVPDDLVKGPGLLGIFRPCLILPQSFSTSLPKDEGAAVIVHELIHLRRRDHLVQAVVLLTQFLYFFNPLVWILAGRIRLERELAVDDQVISSVGEGKRNSYVEVLLRFATGRRPKAIPSIGMAVPRSQVGRRLVRLLADDYHPDTGSRWSAVFLVVLCMLATLALAAGPGKPGDEAGADLPEVRALVSWKRAEVLRDGKPTWVEITGDFKTGPPVPGSLRVRDRLLALPKKGMTSLAEGAVLSSTVDPAGRPGEIRVLRSAGPDVDEVLVEGLKAARFEPTRDLKGKPVPVEIEIRFSFADSTPSAGAVGVPIPPSPEIEAEIAAAYSLKDGEALRLLPPPYPPQRMQLYRQKASVQAAAIPEGPAMMIIEMRKGIPEYGGACFGCNTIGDLLRMAGYQESRLLGDPKILGLPARADILINRSLPKGVFIADLRQQMKEHFGLRLEDVMRKERVIVIRGHFASVHGQASVNGQEAILVSLEEPDDDGGQGGGRANLQQFANFLESQVGIPVEIDGIPEPDETVWFQLHRSAYRTQRVEELLKVIEAQCDLSLSLETRPVHMLLVEKSAN